MPQPDLTLHMIGIMYFGTCGTCQIRNRVLVPNGTASNGHIPPHFASLFVEEKDYETDDWWPTNRIERPVSVDTPGGNSMTNILEFRIPTRATLRFPDGRGNNPSLGNLDQGLLHMADIDPAFVPDFGPTGDWIAQVELRGGALQAFTFNNVSAVQWKMNDDGLLRITATTDAGDTKSLTVKRKPGIFGTEVVFANTPDLLAQAGREQRHASSFHPNGGPTRENPLGHRHTRDESHHFSLYARINQTKDASRLILPKERQTIPSEHAMLKVLDIVDLQAGCSSTCC